MNTKGSYNLTVIAITVKLCHDMAEAASCQPPTTEPQV